MAEMFMVHIYSPPMGRERKGYLNRYVVLAEEAGQAESILRYCYPRAFAGTVEVRDVIPLGRVVPLAGHRV